MHIEAPQGGVKVPLEGRCLHENNLDYSIEK